MSLWAPSATSRLYQHWVSSCLVNECLVISATVEAFYGENNLAPYPMDVLGGKKKKKRKKSLNKHLALEADISSSTAATDIPSEDLHGDDLLAFIDGVLTERPMKWFEINPASRSDPLKTKMIFDNVIERCRPTLTTQTMAIADGLIYKMSAAYRHMKFWKSSRHAFKEFARANMLDFMGPLKSISEKIAAASFEYDISSQTMRYLTALLVARVERLCRASKLAALAASHCVAYVALGHLVSSNILLLSVLSDIYKESVTQVKALLECYDSMRSLVLDSRFPQSVRELDAVKETLKEKRPVGGALSDIRRVVTDALSMNDVDLVNAFISDSERKNMENDFGTPVERTFENSLMETSTETIPVALRDVSEVKENEEKDTELGRKKKKRRRKIEGVESEMQTSRKNKLKRKANEVENEIQTSKENEEKDGELRRKKKKMKRKFEGVESEMQTSKKNKLKRKANEVENEIQTSKENEEKDGELRRKKKKMKRKFEGMESEMQTSRKNKLKRKDDEVGKEIQTSKNKKKTKVKVKQTFEEIVNEVRLCKKKKNSKRKVKEANEDGERAILPKRKKKRNVRLDK
ncbi:unnamed protein product [Toxocara canis]|uniref:DUF4477 domain-containing protein n=1 Tax=Toxocara canis TaxID=6265 RepID=A0A183V463_TOXCA|nr:unnamed protein product [Toxocara canis]